MIRLFSQAEQTYGVLPVTKTTLIEIIPSFVRKKKKKNTCSPLIQYVVSCKLPENMFCPKYPFPGRTFLPESQVASFSLPGR